MLQSYGDYLPFKNKEKRKIYCKEWHDTTYRQWKREIVKKYGGKCTCCGEMNPKFLTLDHLDNTGGIERAKIGRGRSYVRKYAISPKQKNVALRCFNCNCGRQRNGGICPHKESI